MRFSLASATSLLALVLLDGREALATPSVTAGTIVAFQDAFASDGSVSQTPLSSSADRSQVQFADPLASAGNLASAANFSSISATPSGTTGNESFTPRSSGSTGGSVQIADGGPGGTGTALTLGGTAATDPLETIGTSRSAPLAEQLQTVGLTTGSAPAVAQQTTQSGSSVYVVSGGLSALMAAPLATNSASSASFGYSFSPSVGGAGSSNAGTASSDPSGSGQPGNATPGRVIVQPPASATGIFAASGVTFATNGHRSNGPAAASGT